MLYNAPAPHQSTLIILSVTSVDPEKLNTTIRKQKRKRQAAQSRLHADRAKIDQIFRSKRSSLYVRIDILITHPF